MSNRASLDLDAFRALYPWPKRALEQGKPLEWFWIFHLQGDRETLWSQLADTSRLNRALGVSEMKFHERDGVLHGMSRVAGVQQVWVEEPWNWVAGHSLQNLRVYSRGFARYGRGVHYLEQLAAAALRPRSVAHADERY